MKADAPIKIDTPFGKEIDICAHVVINTPDYEACQSKSAAAAQNPSKKPIQNDANGPSKPAKKPVDDSKKPVADNKQPVTQKSTSQPSNGSTTPKAPMPIQKSTAKTNTVQPSPLDTCQAGAHDLQVQLTAAIAAKQAIQKQLDMHLSLQNSASSTESTKPAASKGGSTAQTCNDGLTGVAGDVTCIAHHVDGGISGGDNIKTTTTNIIGDASNTASDVLL